MYEMYFSYDFQDQDQDQERQNLQKKLNFTSEKFQQNHSSLKIQTPDKKIPQNKELSISEQNGSATIFKCGID
mgnify:CR=1 FL=1